MKLYHFDYDGYDSYFYVMAETPDDALTAIKHHINGEFNSWPCDVQNGLCIAHGVSHCSNLWENATLESLPQGYSVREYGPGEVVSDSHD